MSSNISGVKKGLIWSGFDKFSSQIIQFLVSVILARLLTPTDFGTVAIVLVFITIFQTLNESGFNMALINKLDRKDIDYSTAFITNILIGFSGYALLFFLAPIIASFFENEKLTSIIRILSLILIINSFGLVQIAIFTININFKTQAKASIIAALLSGSVGIFIAYSYRSIYAIVVQNIVFSLTNVILLWCFSSWHVSLKFSYSSFRQQFNFASKLMIARLISVIYDDIYSLTIGKVYTASQLAFFNRANSFSYLISRNIVGIMQRVSVPVFCKKQNDYNDLSNELLKFTGFASFIVYPLLTILLVLSKQIVLIVLGNQWIQTVEMLYFVVPIGYMYVICTLNRNIFNATGRTGWALKSEITKKIIFVIVFLLTMHYDIKILLAGLVFNSTFELFNDMYYCRKQIGLPILYQFKSLLPIIIGNLLLATLLNLLKMIINNEYALLTLGVTIGLGAYLTYSYLFNIIGIKKHISNFFHR